MPSGWGKDGWLTVLEREAATFCGGRLGLFPLADDAVHGEPQLKNTQPLPLATRRRLCRIEAGS